MTSESNYYFTDVSELNSFANGLCDKLSVLQLNVQRISNLDKFHDVLIYIGSIEHKPDILIFTETWIVRGTESLYEIPGYRSIHSCRDEQSAGIACFYKQNFYCELLGNSNDEVSYIHFKVCNVNEHDGYVFVTALYMPSSLNFPKLDERLSQILSSVSGNHILMGDFNVNVFQSNLMSRTYVNTLESFGYSIRNTFPTRPSSGTCIDHIVTNFGDTVCVTLENHLSDHNGTFLWSDCIKSPCLERGYVTISRYKTDYEQINEDMSRLDLANLNAESAFTYLHNSLIDSIRNNTSTSVIKVKKNNPHAISWVNENLIKLSKRKHRLLSKRTAGVRSSNLHQRILDVSTKISDLKQVLRMNDRTSKFGPGIDYRTKWRNLNDIMGRKRKKSDISKLTIAEDTTLTDPGVIAESLNNFFVNASHQSPDPTSVNELQITQNHVTNSMFLQPTTPSEVSSVIQGLKMKKSVGWDTISVYVLKKCELTLSSLLAESFNLCVAESYYPRELKVARVVPVFKKDDPTQLNNYRPISILSNINKIYEKLIHTRVLSHLNRNNVLSKHQYGFRRLSSTSSCVIDLMDYIYDGIDRTNIITGVFLDLTKAFDLVDHHILLDKLEASGMRGPVLDFFRSYLFQRSQYVSVNKRDSGPLTVCRGVPQGSILGPLLFLVYVNDISKLSLNGKLFLYADDTALFYSSPSCHQNCVNAEIDLAQLNAFLTANRLSLNAKKTKVIHFRTQRNVGDSETMPIVKLNGLPIETVSSFKYLGLILDTHLTWSDHIEYLIRRIIPILAILHRGKDLIPTDVRKLIYHSMINSCLRYMIEIWGAAAMTILRSIQVIQNRAIRNIFNLPYMTSRLQLYSNPRNNTLPIRGIHESALAEFVYKRRKCLVLSELHFETSNHAYESRNGCLIRKPFCRLSLTQRRVSFAGPSVFNRLPDQCKLSNRLSSFKRGCLEYCRQELVRYLLY